MVKTLVKAVYVDEGELVMEAPLGVVREVFDGDFLMEDDALAFDEENPRRFRLRKAPLSEVRCLVFIDGQAVRERMRG